MHLKNLHWRLLTFYVILQSEMVKSSSIKVDKNFSFESLDKNKNNANIYEVSEGVASLHVLLFLKTIFRHSSRAWISFLKRSKEKTTSGGRL